MSPERMEEVLDDLREMYFLAKAVVPSLRTAVERMLVEKYGDYFE